MTLEELYALKEMLTEFIQDGNKESQITLTNVESEIAERENG